MENCATCLMLGISSVLFAKCCKTKIFSTFTNHTHLQKYNVYYLTCGKSHQRWKQIFPHSASNKKNFVVRSSSNMWPGLYLLRSSLFIYLAGVCGGVTTSEVGCQSIPGVCRETAPHHSSSRSAPAAPRSGGLSCPKVRRMRGGAARTQHVTEVPVHHGARTAGRRVSDVGAERVAREARETIHSVSAR